MTCLTEGGGRLESTDVGISSIIDVWLLVRDIELSGERNRGLYVLKARGMSHSNQIREFLMSAEGIKLVDVYLGPAGMLTGSARVAQEAMERDSALRRQDETRRKLAQLDRKREAMEARIAAIRAEFQADENEVRQALALESEQERTFSARWSSSPFTPHSGFPAPGGGPDLNPVSVGTTAHLSDGWGFVRETACTAAR